MNKIMLHNEMKNLATLGLKANIRIAIDQLDKLDKLIDRINQSSFYKYTQKAA